METSEEQNTANNNPLCGDIKMIKGNIPQISHMEETVYVKWCVS